MLSGTVHNRYEILGILGRGGMGTVYRVKDLSGGGTLALKVLSSENYGPAVLSHFEQEFLSMTKLLHPNFVRVFDFGTVEEPGTPPRRRPFFTMELVDGTTIDKFFSGRLEFRALYRCLADVAKALAYLHSRGYIHHDVKSSNILVSGPLESPSVKLMDLGLVDTVRTATGASIRGTVGYIAPEIARGGRLDPRADIYSLGIVVYEIVAGRLPFRGSSPLSVIRGHLEEQPERPGSINPSVPRALEEIVLRCLEKEPSSRYPGADALLEDLSKAAGEDLGRESREGGRSYVLGGRFVGRERESEILRTAFAESSSEGGRLVLVGGEAGAGKSRLLREFQVHAQIHDIPFHLGRAAGEPRVPYGPFLTILESIVRRHQERIVEPLARAAPAILALLPKLVSLPILAAAVPAAPLEPDEERLRLLGSLTEFLIETSKRVPLVIAVEDLNDADGASSELLRALARSLSPRHAPPGGRGRLLLVGTYRDDELRRQSPLFELIADGRESGVLTEVPLGPLTAADTSRLVASMLGAASVPPAIERRIYEETRGNPSFIEELMTILVDEGIARPASASPFGEIDFDLLDVPRKTRDLIGRRIERLDPGARTLLEAAAVLGAGRLDPAALAAAAGEAWSALLPRIHSLLWANLLERETSADGEIRYRFAQRSVARVVYELAEPGMRAHAHRRYAEWLEGIALQPGAADLSSLAHHFLRGEAPGRAFDYLVRAADLARSVHAATDAIRLYSDAIDLATTGHAIAPGPVLASLYERRGGAYELLARYESAEEDYRWMLARAEKDVDDTSRARAHMNLGNIETHRSEYGRALRAYEEALGILRRIGRAAEMAEVLHRIARIYAKLGEYADAHDQLRRALDEARRLGEESLVVRCLTDAGYAHREQGANREAIACFEEALEIAGRLADRRALAVVLQGYAQSLDVQGKFDQAAARYEEALGIAREIGDIQLVATASTHLGALSCRLGDYDRGLAFFDESLEITRKIGAREAVIPNLHNIAFWHLSQARYEKALEVAEESLRIARKIGKRDDAAISLNLIGAVHQRVGDLAAAGRSLEEAQRIMREINNQRWLAVFLTDLGEYRLLSGEFDRAREHFQEACFIARKIGDRRREAIGMLRLGEAHLGGKDFTRAQSACRKGFSLVEGTPLKKQIADFLLLRARIEAEKPGGSILAAEDDAQQALSVYEELKDFEQAWQAGHLLSRILVRRGDRAGGEDVLRRAHDALESVVGRLPERWKKSYLRDPKRRDLLADWEKLKQGSGSAPSPTPVGGSDNEYARLRREIEKLERLIEINKKLNSTLRLSELLDTILDRAIELTGATRGFLLLSRGDGIAFEAARGTEGADLSEGERAFSRSIAREAMEEGSAILATDAQEDDRFSESASVHELRLRSVIAVPLRLREEVIGALYLDSQLARGVFTNEHVRVLGLFADQAAIAVGNARLVSELESGRVEIERLNAQLSKTVEAQRSEIEGVREELLEKQSSLELRYRFDNIIGMSRAMQGVYRVLDRVLDSRIPILITGESGTGKELIARALHYSGPRKAERFFSVNCAAFTETLLESELFGHRRGAFTGADRDRKGIFELASGGTLFLDEIGDMPLPMQAKLLRVLQEGEILPVGGKEIVKVDVRIVSATNKDLRAQIAKGAFREDLFYRLNVAAIALPSLRQRREDIPLLVDHFLDKFAREESKPARKIEGNALRLLSAYDWPGNIRELEHELLKLVTFARGDTITERDVRRNSGIYEPRPATAPGIGVLPLTSLDESEKIQIVRALDAARGNRSQAAKTLGINRATLFRKMKRFGIEAPESA